jgi:alpha-mannosidase
MNDTMTLSVTFNRGDCYSDFVMMYGDEPGMMYFSVKDGVSGEEEDHVQCYRTLDEMEYLARRILDAVEYQRKHEKED